MGAPCLNEIDDSSEYLVVDETITDTTVCQDPKEHFESDTTDDSIKLEQHQNLSTFPSQFSVKEFFKTLIKDNNLQDQLMTCAAAYALEYFEIFHLLVGIIWCRIAENFQNYLVKNEKTK